MTHYEKQSSKELRAYMDEPLELQFEEIRNTILVHRARAISKVNEEAMLVNWIVGSIISKHLAVGEWGSKVVTQLSEYLRSKDPTLKGYSRRNLYNMVQFYETYSSPSFLSLAAKLPTLPFVQNESAQCSIIVQNGSAQIPEVLNLVTFSHHLEIINLCHSDEERLFYILYAYRERLKLDELKQCISHQTYSILTNKDKSRYSIGLQQNYPQITTVLKDRAVVDFLNLPQRHNEKQLHKGILANMKQFILELGKDFLFVDDEYPLHVGSSTFKIDLLFYHRGLQCLVAVELKAKPFKPEYVGQLEFYLEALDRDVKRSNENPSIGILLCQSADHSVVEYAMSRSLSPTMVAEYQRQLIPKETLQQSFDDFVHFIGETSK